MMNNKLRIIAGPCAIESEEMCLEVGSCLKEVCDTLDIDYIFKSSFDKANRTSIYSRRGPGLIEGMAILSKIKEELGILITSDIHEPWQASEVSSVVDIIQIPAFLCRQTDLLVAAAKTGKIVNVKKAQFLAPWDMKNVINKLREAGANEIWLTERGSMFGYNRLIVDYTGIVEMLKFNCPIVFDATHSVQIPGGNGDSTSGNREYVEALSLAAVSAGVSNIFFEVHPDPDNAISDGPNQISIDQAISIIKKIKTIYDLKATW